jgi:hypothetical protein
VTWHARIIIVGAPLLDTNLSYIHAFKAIITTHHDKSVTIVITTTRDIRR